MSTSPSIDIGDNSAPDLPIVDIDGNQRIIDGDGNDLAVVDIGVDEFEGFIEDFDSELTDFTKDPYFSISDGRLQFNGDPSLSSGSRKVIWNGGDNPADYPLPSHSNYFENYIVSVDTNWGDRATDVPYGLLLCGPDPDSGATNCIGHRVNKDQEYSIGRSLDGGSSKGYIVFNTFFPLINSDGQNNTLAVKKVGPYFYFFINGVEVQRRLLEYFHGGLVGLYGFHPVAASFDNFAVSEIGYEELEDESNSVLEDFNTGSGGFRQSSDFMVSEGRLFFSGDGSDYIILTVWMGGLSPGGYYPEPEHSNYFKNFDVSVDVRWEDGADYVPYGLIVCTQNSIDLLDSVEFYISDDGWYFIRRYDDGVGELLVPWTESDHILTGGSENNIRVEKNDSRFSFFINNEVVETLTISGYTGGGVGYAIDDDVDVSFDNFSITQSGTPPVAYAGTDIWTKK